MANYVKVRPYVARRLGVLDSRYRYADGDVQLFDKDLAGVDAGWVFRKEATVANIGGLMMDPYRNKEEQMKTADECTVLPDPVDPSWLPMDGEVTEEMESQEDTVMESEEGGDS